MYLGDIWIAPEEVERIAWEDGELTLDLRWELDYVPLLFNLPRHYLLRWHLEDPNAGITLQLHRWRFYGSDSRLCLEHRL